MWEALGDTVLDWTEFTVSTVSVSTTSIDFRVSSGGKFLGSGSTLIRMWEAVGDTVLRWKEFTVSTVSVSTTSIDFRVSSRSVR
jgi:hypothetical protein